MHIRTWDTGAKFYISVGKTKVASPNQMHIRTWDTGAKFYIISASEITKENAGRSNL